MDLSTSNEQLALLAKEDFSHIEQLWLQVERLIGMWAGNYSKQIEGNRFFDEDDLMQAGFLAVCDTVRQYSPERGAFNTLLKFNVRNRFAEVGGHRGTKKRPELYAQSLDEPISDNAETTYADLIEDECANFEDDLIELVANEQKCTAILSEIDKLPHEQRQALMLTAWDGLSFSKAAEQTGWTYSKIATKHESAINSLRNTRTGRIIALDYAPRHVSLSEFRRTGTSEVEKHVLWLDKQRY